MGWDALGQLLTYFFLNLDGFALKLGRLTSDQRRYFAKIAKI